MLLTTPLWVVNTRLKLQGAKFRNEDIIPTNYKGIIGRCRSVGVAEVCPVCLNTVATEKLPSRQLQMSGNHLFAWVSVADRTHLD